MQGSMNTDTCYVWFPQLTKNFKGKETCLHFFGWQFSPPRRWLAEYLVDSLMLFKHLKTPFKTCIKWFCDSYLVKSLTLNHRKLKLQRGIGNRDRNTSESEFTSNNQWSNKGTVHVACVLDLYKKGCFSVPLAITCQNCAELELKVSTQSSIFTGRYKLWPGTQGHLGPEEDLILTSHCPLRVQPSLPQMLEEAMADVRMKNSSEVYLRPTKWLWGWFFGGINLNLAFVLDWVT